MGYLLDPNDPNNPLNQYLQGKMADPTAALLAQYPQLAQAPAAPADSAVGGFDVSNPSGTASGFAPAMPAMPPKPPAAPILPTPAPAPALPVPGPAEPDQQGDEDMPAAAQAPSPTPASAPTGPAPVPAPDGPQSVNDILGSKYNDDARQELYDRLNKRGNAGSVISEAMSGLGDAIARSYGGQQTDYLKTTMGNEDKKRQALSDQFKEGRAQAVQDYTLGRQIIENKRKDIEAGRETTDYEHKQAKYDLDQRQLKASQDPTSPLSLGAVRAAEIADPKGAAQGMYKGKSAYELNPEMGEIQKSATIDAERSKTREATALRLSEQQDKLEQQARQGLETIRGDHSLQQTETQRDAAISAYNRLQEVGRQGKGLNPIDYVDAVGQLYKARTGAAPTNEVLQHALQMTAKGQLDKAYTYITGNQSPATSDNIVASLKDMAASMGTQADLAHDGYMKTRLVKPTGLDDSRWASIANTGRGRSFSEATGYKQQQSAEPTVSKTIGGKTYVRHDGQWYAQ